MYDESLIHGIYLEAQISEFLIMIYAKRLVSARSLFGILTPNNDHFGFGTD